VIRPAAQALSENVARQFFVDFASRIALIRLGSAASIRSKIRAAANPAQFSDRT
jgi:hypothetical protein